MPSPEVTMRGAMFIRPLPSYEPAPARRAAPECHGQLALPLHPERINAWQPREPLPVVDSRTPARPPDAELRCIVAALVEAAAGRRSLESLIGRLSVGLYRKLRTRPDVRLGRRFGVQRVHTDQSEHGLLRLCATVRDHTFERCFATVSTVEASWAGWRFTEFVIMAPTSTTSPQRAAAAKHREAA